MRRLAALIAVTLFATLPLHAEQKNVKVLTGLSDFELLRAMQLIRASLGVGCDFCHAATPDGKGLDFASDAKKTKETARQMMTMTKAINTQNFEGRPQVGCETCHRGSENPVSVLPLPQPLPAERPRGETASASERPAHPTPPTRDEVVSRYAAAIGHPSRAQWESRRLVGTREGSDGKPLPMTLEESPAGAHVTVTMDNGTMEQAATTTAGWSRNPRGVRAMSGPDFALFQSLKSAYDPPLPESIPADARVFRRSLDTKDPVIVSYRSSPTTRERLEFDPATGLLQRRTTLIDTPVGMANIQTDYDDWRDVGGGVKYPFTVRVSPYDARVGSTRHYSEVTLGAKLNEKELEQPK